MFERRDFLKAAGLAALGLALDAHAQPKTNARWRGFNLTDKFVASSNRPYREQDFDWMAGWGFNFARLPLDYRCWAGPNGEQALKEIDQAIAWGKQYRIHISLNLHRAPGYCVSPPAEPLSLWKDPQALDDCAAQWRMLARRCKGIPAAAVSFNLLNEPAGAETADYVRVVRRLVETIRETDPTRPIMADGFNWGSLPVADLASLDIIQSTRGYAPMQISHYKAEWVGNPQTPPAWPLRIEHEDKQTGKRRVELWDRDRLVREIITPWRRLAEQGVRVHVGEFGAYCFTPHPIVMAWLRDYLDLWKEAGWGWSMWNLRGSFGIVDSGRADVKYEAFHGHKLDRALLELLRQS